jgi:hypothetical protein
MSDFFLADDRLSFDDLEIFLLKDDSAERYAGRDDLLYMFKHAGYVRAYEQIKCDLVRQPVAGIFEIGIYRGGSAVFLHRLFDAGHVVCVDNITTPAAPLEDYRRRHPGAITPYYGVDQADRALIQQILRAEFALGVDLVIDDASHLYEETKAAFETAFPHLIPGGIYAIEDWNWAHGDVAQLPDHPYAAKPALSNLVFELLILFGTDRGIIDHVGFGPGIMWVRRGWQPLPDGEFRLDRHLPTRGRALGQI